MAGDDKSSEDASDKSFKCCVKQKVKIAVCVTCGNVFHRSCLERVKSYVTIDETRIICCQSEEAGKQPGLINSKSLDPIYAKIISDEIITHLRNEISLLRTIIQEKDEKYAVMLENKHLLNEKVGILSDKNQVLQKHHEDCSLIQIDKANPAKKRGIPDRMTNEDKSKQDKKCQEPAADMIVFQSTSLEREIKSDIQQPITKNDVFSAVTRAQDKSKLEKYINLENDAPSASNSRKDDWTEVVRRKPKRNCIIGKNEESLKGVPKNITLHVCRLNPQTTTEDLTNLLIRNFPEVKCEALNSRFPTLYSSYKVTLFETNFKKAMNPEVWPFGACISRFFVKRRGTTTTT
ncbi:unnamed protein product [Phaedon cochleariae]|uniref:Uncharacterized protein n=1 Tax=Phaedon cochleariae TaxID=80249 RepID=A0A9N9S903_PHACE|nr:unnamed protein product [Phaedon cochleariae]